MIVRNNGRMIICLDFRWDFHYKNDVQVRELNREPRGTRGRARRCNPAFPLRGKAPFDLICHCRSSS